MCTCRRVGLVHAYKEWHFHYGPRHAEAYNLHLHELLTSALGDWLHIPGASNVHKEVPIGIT